MGRPTGTRNADYERKRADLAVRAGAAWMSRGPGVTFHQISEALGVSIPTLKHYFADRQGLFEAALSQLHQAGQRFIDEGAVPRAKTPREAILRFFESLLTGWRHFGVGRMHAVTLAEGLKDAAAGRAYVSHVLEPSLDSCERLLAALIAKGQLPKRLEVRRGALALVGPVVLALLHQDALDGGRCRPLDLDAFVPAHVDAWLHGHAARGRAGGRPVGRVPR